jgi:hypothetical protein
MADPVCQPRSLETSSCRLPIDKPGDDVRTARDESTIRVSVHEGTPASRIALGWLCVAGARQGDRVKGGRILAPVRSTDQDDVLNNLHQIPPDVVAALERFCEGGGRDREKTDCDKQQPASHTTSFC